MLVIESNSQIEVLNEAELHSIGGGRSPFYDFGHWCAHVFLDMMSEADIHNTTMGIG